MAVNVVTTGIQGPPGPAGNSYTYLHQQNTPLMIWQINHNLRKFPTVWLEELDGTPMRARIDHLDDRTVTITFSAPAAGIARLN